jgi:hypothetical protein
MRSLLFVLLAGSATGCVIDSWESAPPMRPVPLIESPHLELLAKPGSLDIRLAYGEYGADCAQWPTIFRASVNDVPMRLTQGSVADYGLDSADWVCQEPTAHLSDAPESAVLVLADEATTFEIDLGTALAQRTARLVGGTDWTRGMTYDVEWSPASDLAEGRPDAAWLTAYNAYAPGTLTYDTSLLHVAMPSPLALPYNGPATLSFTWYEPREEPCRNCTLVVSGNVSQQITVH